MRVGKMITPDFVLQKLAFLDELQQAAGEMDKQRAADRVAKKERDDATPWWEKTGPPKERRPAMAASLIGGGRRVVPSGKRTPVVKSLSPSYQLGIRALSIGGNAGPSSGPSTPSVRRTDDERYYGPGAERVNPQTANQYKNLDDWQKGRITRDQFFRKMMFGM